MKQFLVILRFELSAYFKNKVFMGLTIAMIVIIGGILLFPMISGYLGKGSEVGNSAMPEEPVPNKTLLVQCDDATYAYLEKALLPQGFFAARSQLSTDEMQAAVDREEYSAAAIVTSPTSFTSLVRNITLLDDSTQIFSKVLADYYKTTRLMALGADITEADAIMNVQIESTVIQSGKDQTESFFFTYILIFALYISILLYGQLVTTSVATEKSSRAMELLITSAKPSSLLFGKVIGAGFAGLLQLFLVLGSATFFFGISKDSWANNPIVGSIFNIPPYLLGYMLIFFVLGFFIYAFLFGAIGSLASKLEDVNTLSMPVTLIFIAAFMVVMTSMTNGNIDSPLMAVCSYIPLTSPMAMFTRIAMGNVAGYEIALSVAILFVSTLGIGYLAAKIYRMGVLLYGSKPNLGSILKGLRHS